MATRPLPTASEAITETRLRPQQVSPGFTSADFAADADRRIEEESAMAERKSGHRYPDMTENDTDPDARLWKEWVLLRVAASIYHTAGQLNEAYEMKARDYDRRAAEIEAALEESPTVTGNGVLTAGGTPATTYSTSLRRYDAYSEAQCGEYARNRCR